MGSEELKDAVRRLFLLKRKGDGGRRIGFPESAFDAVVEERLRILEEAVNELRAKVNGLIFTVLGAVLVEVVLKVLR